jgi:uncharacterized protein (TIGR02145 family)
MKKHKTHKTFTKLSLLVCMVLLSIHAMAQAPEKMSYQAVIRNSSNNLLVNQSVGMRISIVRGSVNGNIVFEEGQTAVTNSNGLVSIEIGGGTLLSGNFQTINWGNGPYFLKTETDPNGGNNYSITGTTQILSVPYALFSGNGISGISASGDTLYLGSGNHLIVPGISAANAPQPFNGAHSCGADSMHNTNLNYGSMIDQDGNTYKTITIGTQEWMAENLKASHYRNGNLIPMLGNNTDWQNNTNGAAAWPAGDSTTHACPYGKLYNWFAAGNASGICPAGWHLPSDTEWNLLIAQLDPGLVINTYGIQSTFAGGQLKSASGQYWLSPNTGAGNASGFSAPGAGIRDVDGTYLSFKDFGFFWSATPDLGSTVFYRGLYSNFAEAFRNAANTNVGMSVRCVKDN